MVRRKGAAEEKNGRLTITNKSNYWSDLGFEVVFDIRVRQTSMTCLD